MKVECENEHEEAGKHVRKDAKCTMSRTLAAATLLKTARRSEEADTTDVDSSPANASSANIAGSPIFKGGDSAVICHGKQVILTALLRA
jgi:hypothetical protein